MAEAAQLKEILSQSGMRGRQDSGPNVRQPRIKKTSEKQQEMKTRLSLWVTKRPASGLVRQKAIQRRSFSDQDLITHKRMLIQNRQKGLSNCYGSTLGSHSKTPAESRCYSAPPKPAIQQNSANEKLYKPRTRDEDRNVASRGLHAEPTRAPRHCDFSRFGENTRLTPRDLEKKRYQTIAEYQFMTPGKTFYYCTRENMKQRLRSIYLAHQPGQKPPKSAHQTNWPPVCYQEKHRTLRRNPFPGAPGLVHGEFPGDFSSLCTSPPPHGVMELAHKVSKLVLVSKEMRGHQENSLKRRPVNLSHTQQLNAEEPVLSANKLHLSSAAEGKANKGGHALEQGFSVNMLPQGSGIKTLQALKAVQGIIDKGRGTSGKDHIVTARKKKHGTGNSLALVKVARLNFSKDSVDKEDTTEDLLGLPQSSNSQDTGAPYDSKDNAIIIPGFDCPLTPDESTDMELLPNGHSSTSKLAESPPVENGQASHPRTERASDPSFTSPWEKPSGVPEHCISMEKGHECCIYPSGALQEPLGSGNKKDVFWSVDNLSDPFQRKCPGTEVLFSLSDDDDHE